MCRTIRRRRKHVKMKSSFPQSIRRADLGQGWGVDGEVLSECALNGERGNECGGKERSEHLVLMVFV